MTSDIIDTLSTLVKNKYVVCTVIFVAWTGLFDSDSLLTQYGYSQKIEELKREKARLTKSIEDDSRKMEELKNNRVTLEKFAREEYFMKKKNEVIFIIK